jgi:hypothetical protein
MLAPGAARPQAGVGDGVYAGAIAKTEDGGEVRAG